MSIQQLVATLYEFISEPGREQVFVGQYTERVGAPTGAIVVLTDFASGRNQVPACTRIDSAYRKAYEEYYGSINVYVERLKQMRTPAVGHPAEAICPDDELARTHIMRILWKTETTRRGKLVHLALSSAPLRALSQALKEFRGNAQ